MFKSRMLVLLLLIPALAGPFLPEKIVSSILLIILLAYSASQKVSLAINDVDFETSIFNTLLFATVVYFSTFFGIPESIVLAALFIVAAHEFRGVSLQNIGIFTIFGLAYFFYYHQVTATPIDYNMLFFLSLIGGLTAALVESIDVSSDKRATMMLAVATAYLIFDIYKFNVSGSDLGVAFLLAFLLSMAAMKSGIADESGLMSATLVGTLVIVFTRIEFFLLLVTFYLVGSVSTKYKYSLKMEMGVAEPAGGARGYANVFGNSLAPLFFAMTYGVYGHDVFLLGFVASVAAALGDTMASEIGKSSDKVYLITNFSRVRSGVSGGVSAGGELAALLGVAIIAIASYPLNILVSWQHILIVLAAGFIAIHLDSVLGATAEEKGYLTNSGVNFVSTLSSGLFCYILLGY